MDAAARSLVERSADLLEALRARAPLVQCITNTVVQTVTANTLLALGASPAMVDVPTEAGPFAHAADALLVNTGTPHAEQRTGALEAATAATTAAGSGTPWVLDPVAIGALPVRTALAARLLALRPTVVRGNASEVLALTGGSGGRGTDSTAAPEDAVASSLDLAGRLGVTSAVSGPVDVVVGSRSIVRIANGTPMLTRVTGGGCALGAVTAAFLAVAGADLDGTSNGTAPADRGPTPDEVVTATAAATIAYTVAAEAAAARSAGPGSFSPALLDALAALTPEDVRRDARVTVTRVPAGSVAGTAA